ncbi:hypothetical protein [Amycolatopsis marina]|uniref:hypothetical protein n=1 Tax=Amycolatopsis marina TaxID=490629 RepID=UPI0015A6A4A5|nr:hypothetical protein [Amycolatopsis marina]
MATSTRSRCAIAMTPGLRDEVLPLLRVLRGSRFWPDDNEPDDFGHRAAPLGTEVLP